MKRIYINIILIGVLVFISTGCSDFFETDNDTQLRGDDYVKEVGELYSGFLGIVTKMQAIGDKAIYLTDIRAELLEPTENTPSELYSLYNYDDDLSGNSYADPAKYYDVIIACNDYMHKAKEYKDAHETSIDADHYKGLISSAVRVKVWIYLTLGKIYGQAVWFDDPVYGMVDFSKYETKDLTEIIDACDNLLNTGYDGIDGTYLMKWGEWLDPSEGSTSVSDEYKRWDMMVPEFFVLKAEIALWKNDGATAASLLLSEMNKAFEGCANNSGEVKYMRSGSYSTQYGRQYDNATPVNAATESVIMYDYKYNQKNSLLKHFDYSGGYMLRAALPAVKRFKDVTFNPPSDDKARETSDGRFKAFKEIVVDEEYSIQKYRGFSKSGHKVENDDVHINIYHTADLYFMLVEALNLQNRYTPVSVLMNKGVNTYFNNGDVTLGDPVMWQGFTNQWTKFDGRGYPDAGIRGIFGRLGNREIWETEDDMNAALEEKPELEEEYNLSGLSDAQQKIKKHNDIELLKEALLEFPCEGKTYPLMIRIAKRWNDYSLISRFVCEKYPESKQAEIRSKIENSNAYFVPWDLTKTASSH